MFFCCVEVFLSLNPETRKRSQVLWHWVMQQYFSFDVVQAERYSNSSAEDCQQHFIGIAIAIGKACRSEEVYSLNCFNQCCAAR